MSGSPKRTRGRPRLNQPVHVLEARRKEQLLLAQRAYRVRKAREFKDFQRQNADMLAGLNELSATFDTFVAKAVQRLHSYAAPDVADFAKYLSVSADDVRAAIAKCLSAGSSEHPDYAKPEPPAGEAPSSTSSSSSIRSKTKSEEAPDHRPNVLNAPYSFAPPQQPAIGLAASTAPAAGRGSVPSSSAPASQLFGGPDRSSSSSSFGQSDSSVRQPPPAADTHPAAFSMLPNYAQGQTHDSVMKIDPSALPPSHHHHSAPLPRAIPPAAHAPQAASQLGITPDMMAVSNQLLIDESKDANADIAQPLSQRLFRQCLRVVLTSFSVDDPVGLLRMLPGIEQDPASIAMHFDYFCRAFKYNLPVASVEDDSFFPEFLGPTAVEEEYNEVILSVHLDEKLFIEEVARNSVFLMQSPKISAEHLRSAIAKSRHY